MTRELRDISEMPFTREQVDAYQRKLSAAAELKTAGKRLLAKLDEVGAPGAGRRMRELGKAIEVFTNCEAVSVPVYVVLDMRESRHGTCSVLGIYYSWADADKRAAESGIPGYHVLVKTAKL